MKIALLGDPHAKLNSLSEISLLIDYVSSLKKESKADKLVILGDLFDTHSVVRLEIWKFWEEQLSKLSKSFSAEEIIIISGNHDKPGSTEREYISAVATLNGNKATLIYDKGEIKWDITFVPFCSQEESFLQQCNDLYKQKPTKYIICHQTFNGAVFDNGMYAPDGFDFQQVPHENIVSGHIHTTLRFGKVFYPGTARWDSMSDANKEKGIYVLDTDTDNYDFYSTDTIVTPMYSIEIKEGEDFPELKSMSKYAIHLIGTSKWISKTKAQCKGHKVKTTYTDSMLKRSSDKPENFNDFVGKITTSVKKEDILRLIEEL